MLLRIAVGVNFIGHGLVRFPKIAGFREWMLKEFEGSMLPDFLVSPFATVLPFAEFAVGLLLLLGLFTYRAAIAGAVIIIMLIFGSCLIENWSAVGSQMVYILLFYFLIAEVRHDSFGLDGRRKSL